MSFGHQLIQSLKPISILMNILGLRPYYSNKNGIITYSKFKSVITMCFIITYSFVFYIFNLGRDSQIKHTATYSLIFIIVTKVYIYVYGIEMIVIFCYGFYNANKLERFMRQVFDVIKDLMCFRLKEKILNIYKSLYNHCLTFTVCFPAFYIIIELSISIILLIRVNFELLIVIYLASISIPNIIEACANIFYAATVKHLNLVLEVVNYNIQNYMNNYQMSSRFVDNLQARLDIYNKFAACIQSYNRMYSFFLFWILFGNFTSSFVNSYFIMFKIVFDFQSIIGLATLMFVKNCMKSIISFCILVTHMVNLSNEVSKYLFKVSK